MVAGHGGESDDRRSADLFPNCGEERVIARVIGAPSRRPDRYATEGEHPGIDLAGDGLDLWREIATVASPLADDDSLDRSRRTEGRGEHRPERRVQDGIVVEMVHPAGVVLGDRVEGCITLAPTPAPQPEAVHDEPSHVEPVVKRAQAVGDAAEVVRSRAGSDDPDTGLGGLLAIHFAYSCSIAGQVPGW